MFCIYETKLNMLKIITIPDAYTCIVKLKKHMYYLHKKINIQIVQFEYRNKNCDEERKWICFYYRSYRKSIDVLLHTEVKSSVFIGG